MPYAKLVSVLSAVAACAASMARQQQHGAFTSAHPDRYIIRIAQGFCRCTRRLKNAEAKEPRVLFRLSGQHEAYLPPGPVLVVVASRL